MYVQKLQTSTFIKICISCLVVCVGVFIAKGGKDDALVTKNLDVGNSVYGEKRISVEVTT